MNQKNHDQMAALMEQLVAFNRHLGIQIDELRTGFSRFKIAFRPEFIGDPRRPALHGGITSTLIDACGGAAAWTMVDPHDQVSTIDMRVDYLLPGPPKDLVAESTVKRFGSRVAVVDTHVFAEDDPGTIVAEGRAAYSVRRVDRS